MIEAAAELVENCARFSSVKTDCRGCQITAVCWSGPTGKLTLEAIDEPNARLNAANARLNAAAREMRK